ncbi:hypothetical protein SBBP2_710003 [Burkholderiales bacterium]|nr:hypothetical protein SBBP2_710003 [Burkholderiales bacterium]
MATLGEIHDAFGLPPEDRYSTLWWNLRDAFCCLDSNDRIRGRLASWHAVCEEPQNAMVRRGNSSVRTAAFARAASSCTY